jgi:DNA-directed RNA polymerase specialized sigma24 family protein
MKNTFINNYRRNPESQHHHRQYRRSLLPEYSQEIRLEAPDSITPKKRSARAISRLSSDQRLPFRNAYRWLQIQEIADSINISIGTLKAASLHKAENDGQS